MYLVSDQEPFFPKRRSQRSCKECSYFFFNQFFVRDFSKTNRPIYMKLLDLIEKDLSIIDLDFKGPEVRNLDPQYLRMEENSEKQYCTEDVQNIELNNMQPS